jgi:hypothetical protein
MQGLKLLPPKEKTFPQAAEDPPIQLGGDYGDSD